MSKGIVIRRQRKKKVSLQTIGGVRSYKIPFIKFKINTYVLILVREDSDLSSLLVSSRTHQNISLSFTQVTTPPNQGQTRTQRIWHAVPSSNRCDPKTDLWRGSHKKKCVLPRRAHWCQTTEQRGNSPSPSQGVRPLPKGREKGPQRQGQGRPTSEAFSASRRR
jgi:hypothetical protein